MSSVHCLPVCITLKVNLNIPVNSLNATLPPKLWLKSRLLKPVCLMYCMHNKPNIITWLSSAVQFSCEVMDTRNTRVKESLCFVTEGILEKIPECTA